MKGISCLADVTALSAQSREGQPTTSGELLVRAAERFGDRIALSFLPDPARPDVSEDYSYRRLVDSIGRAASWFRARGINRGDVVAYALPNSAMTHIVLWGAEAAGTVMAINPALAAAQIIGLLKAVDARLLVTTPALAATLSGDGCAVETVLVDDLAAGLERQPDGTALLLEPKRDDLASFFCTGGTTGAPKVAMRTHDTETGNVQAFVPTMGDHLSHESVLLCGLPLFHVNAVMVTGLMPWSVGARVILAGPDGYRAPALIENFWSIVERYRVSFFAGVPTIFARLLEQPTEGRDLSSLDAAICGAAPMPTELFRRFEAATGIRILEGYGLTEGGCVSTINPIEGDRRIGSIGVTLPWQDLVIAEVDGDGAFVRRCEANEVGSVLIAGANVFRGYFDPVHNKGAWPDLGDGRRWFNTGDLGRMDADGYVWLTGRRKELIIRGGHNIDPALIEEALNCHPAVGMTAAVGRPDGDVGEVPVAYVQLRDGKAATPEELMDHARKHIPERAAIPKAIRIVAALPLTPVGKLFKPALVLREAEDVATGEAIALGLAPAIAARQDPARGVVVTVGGLADTTALATALSRYAFKVDFEG